MAILFIGTGSVKTYAAEKLPVGGLSQKPLPVNKGMTKVPEGTPAINVTPRRARLTTGRHYQYLTDEEKFLYAAVYQAIMDRKFVPYSEAGDESKYVSYKYYIHTGKETYIGKFQNDVAFAYALLRAQYAAACDHPDKVELDMVSLSNYGYDVNNGTYSTYITMVATVDDTKFDEYDAAIEANANAIVNEIKNNRNATSAWDAVNELAAHDYYCGDYELEYDNEGLQNAYDYCHTAYGSIVLHKAVCDGYSKGFEIILEKLGIPAMVNDGMAYFMNGGGGGGHAWNLVQLDGNWYEVDTTWDDLEGNAISYDFFNKTTTEFKRGYPEGGYAKHVRGAFANYCGIRYPAATGTHWTKAYLDAANYAKDTTVKLNSMSFQNSVYIVEPGKEFKLELFFAPEEAANKRYSIFSSDASVVYADVDNICTSQKPGTVTIRAIAEEDDGIVAECTVIVSNAFVPVTGVSIDKEISIAYGQEIELKPVITPEDASYKTFKLESSDEEVVSVDGNKIKGLKQGDATIKVTTIEGEYTAECKVSVAIPDGEVFDVAGYKYIVTGAGEAALVGSKNTKLNIPESFEAAGATFKVTSIGDGAFLKNKKITQVKGGKNLKYIGRDAFYKCTGLKSVDLSNSAVTDIGYQAFFKCKKLSNLKINGNTLKTCEKDIIAGIKKKAKITVCSKNKKNYNNAVKIIKETGVSKVTFKRGKK